MYLRTILNQFHKFRGFDLEFERLGEVDGRPAIIITVRPIYGSKAICSECGTQAPGYDTLKVRNFQFIPFWGFLVFLAYAMRRDVSYTDCGLVWIFRSHSI
jgi:transposase